MYAFLIPYETVKEEFTRVYEIHQEYPPSSLILEEDENASPCNCLLKADPMNNVSSNIPHMIESREQKHKHHVEWVQVIRTSLFPILLSIVVVLILIRILFMIHDADHLLTFLQTVLGLFGASASGYVYAQTKQPGEPRSKHMHIFKRDSNGLDLNGSSPNEQDRNIP